jgi:NDP-mannose synthase
MKSIVLAGGKGARLAPYTHILPKPLMPIGGMPILEILIRQMKASHIDQVIITVGHLGSLIQTFFGAGEKFGIPIDYSMEDCPLGTAGPLALVNDLNETFLVCNGDVLTDLRMADLIAFHKTSGGIATIAMYTRHVHIDLGVIQLNGGHAIEDYIEKPTLDFQVSMGIYVFEPGVLRFIPKGQYLDFPDLVKLLLSNGEKVVGYPFSGYWQDLGRADDYQQAVIDFEANPAQFLIPNCCEERR